MYKAYKDLRRSLGMYHVWLYQAYYNISSKYKRTFLGSLWISLSYVLYTFGMATLWGALFGRNLHDVLPYVMFGYLIAQFVFWILNDAPEIFISNSGIIRNHAYPANYYVLEGGARAFMTLLHNLPIALVATAIVGASAVPDWTIIIGLPVVILTVLTWGMVIAMASSRFRDLRFLLPQIGAMLMFMTPVYWRRDMLHSHYWIADVNPFAALISLIREPLLGRPPSNIEWSVALGYSIVGIIFYMIVFPAFRKRIPFWV